jgi:transcriptional regulator with XRE-family HTH domain
MLKDNLNTVMEIRGENPHSLAAKSGVSQPTIYRIASGETRRPSGEVVAKLARALLVTTDELYGKLRDFGSARAQLERQYADEPAHRPTDAEILEQAFDMSAPKGAGNVAGAPRPVVAFDDADPVESDEVLVPRLTLKLSAGSGRLNWEIDQKGTPNRFRKSWCQRKGLKPEALVTVPISGDSMSPGIPDGASVTINTAELALRNGKPHAIDYMGEFFIKRLFRQPDGSVLVRSDNPDKTRHPDWTIPPEHGDALRILGAPVAISADLD